MAEYKRKVDAFEVWASPGKIDQFVSVYVATGDRCDVNLYLPVSVARELANCLREAADAAEK